MHKQTNDPVSPIDPHLIQMLSKHIKQTRCVGLLSCCPMDWAIDSDGRGVGVAVEQQVFDRVEHFSSPVGCYIQVYDRIKICN